MAILQCVLTAFNTTYFHSYSSVHEKKEVFGLIERNHAAHTYPVKRKTTTIR